MALLRSAIVQTTTRPSRPLVEKLDTAPAGVRETACMQVMAPWCFVQRALAADDESAADSPLLTREENEAIAEPKEEADVSVRAPVSCRGRSCVAK